VLWPRRLIRALANLGEVEVRAPSLEVEVLHVLALARLKYVLFSLGEVRVCAILTPSLGELTR
jgi:hypothetical protein